MRARSRRHMRCSSGRMPMQRAHRDRSRDPIRRIKSVAALRGTNRAFGVPTEDAVGREVWIAVLEQCLELPDLFAVASHVQQRH